MNKNLILGLILMIVLLLYGCDSSIIATFTNCPQLNFTVSITDCPESIPCLRYDGDLILSLTNDKWTAQSNSYVNCRDARLEGENKNYMYCDSGGRIRGLSDTTAELMSLNFDKLETEKIPFIVKKPEEEGDIIKKQNYFRKSFINIYSKDWTFIKTVCGKDPVDIYQDRKDAAERKFKDNMNKLDQLFE